MITIRDLLVSFGQGRDAVKQLMDDNPDLMNEIELKIREAVQAKALANA